MNDTKTKILDTAERLIMELGADKASLRKITEEAGVNLAAINYHFGSKNNLVSAIMVRILSPLMEELDKGLKAVMEEAGNKKPELEAIIRSYLVPLLRFSRQNPDHESMFARLFASYDDDDVFRHSIRDLVKKSTRFYGDCFIKALPELHKRTVFLRMAFFRNTSLGIMEGNCLMEESMTILGFDMDYDKMIDEMVEYGAAGFRGGYS